MNFQEVSLDGCGAADGTVVVVDVLRAFTTAAAAFAAGAREIQLVGTVDGAFAVRADRPDVLLMGEVDGLPVAGFDLSNSPVEVAAADVAGRTLVHRSTAGTQGVVRSEGADVLLGASFACAAATVRLLRSLDPPSVTFVITGVDEARDGDEDRACADYLAASLTGGAPDAAPYLERVHRSTTGRAFRDPALPDFPREDLDVAVDVDRFDRALWIERRDGALVMTAVENLDPVPPPPAPLSSGP